MLRQRDARPPTKTSPLAGLIIDYGVVIDEETDPI